MASKRWIKKVIIKISTRRKKKGGESKICIFYGQKLVRKSRKKAQTVEIGCDESNKSIPTGTGKRKRNSSVGNFTPANSSINILAMQHS
jgi:hypothetical protein